jgi:hypothetical protein
MGELIEKLKEIEQLYLPNGAKGAVWLDDVIAVVEKHYGGHVELEVNVTSEIGADIRNKLSPMKNLIAMLKDSFFFAQR